MQDLKVTFDGDAVREVVSAAILQSMDAGQRDALIQTAIKSLMTPAKGTYSVSGTTPLQDAFSQAVWQVARDVAQQMMAEDETVKAAIEALIRDAVTAAIEGEGREKIVTSMAEGVRRAFTPNDRF